MKNDPIIKKKSEITPIKSKSKIPFIIGLVTTLIVALLIGGYFYSKSPKVEILKKAKEAKLKSKGMEFVFVKAGCYDMGDTFGDGDRDEKPVHRVCLDDFYMGKYEVTQGQWKEIMGNNPSSYKKCGDNCPVESVSWNNVQEFIKKLNQRRNAKYRLPSEAEWEYACREGGRKVRFGTGTNRINANIANFDASARNKRVYSDVGKRRSKTTRVGTFSPNNYGLYDMSGNVYEWVQDTYKLDAYKHHLRNNPIDTRSSSVRVARGGSWGTTPRVVRCANRHNTSPYLRNYGVGFRLIRIK